MDNIISTIHGSYLQSCHYLNKPFTVDPNTTLNRKFNIHSNVPLLPNELPIIGYVAIGNGGHRILAAANDIPRLSAVVHGPKHAALYNHVPFVLRSLDNDLTTQQRAGYRLRRIETHNNISYIAYYLKKLNVASVTPVIELRSVTDGVTTSTPFISSINDLNPAPIELQSGQLLTPNGDYIAVSSRIEFIMNDFDISEYMNACRIIYSDDSYAIISEMALCSGVDKTFTETVGLNTLNYTDSIAVQIVTFMNVMYQMQFINTNISVMIDIGSVEPLLVTS